MTGGQRKAGVNCKPQMLLCVCWSMSQPLQVVAKFLHCKCTAGKWIKEQPEEKAETSSEAKADAATQQNNLILTNLFRQSCNSAATVQSTR